MKISRRLILIPILLASVQVTAKQDQTNPIIYTTGGFASPISDLAAGYAKAASFLSETRLVVFYKSEGRTVTLKGIRSLRAMGGVLLITISTGESVAISAVNILLITDGGFTP